MFNEFPHLADESLLEAAYSKISESIEPAAQSGEAPAQQLKAAIALVRSEATFLLPSCFESFNSVLSQIEQRAAV